MKQKKKIDDIYREGLRNAETPPPADSWEFISSRLPEEKKERVLPLWIKWGGVAAVFALLITLFNFTLFDTPLPEPLVNREEQVNSTTSPASKITPEAETRISNTEVNEQQEPDKFQTEIPSETIASENTSNETEAVHSRSKQENKGFYETLASQKTTSEEKYTTPKNNRTAVTPLAENSDVTGISEDKDPAKTTEISAPAEVVAPASEIASETSKRVLEKELLKEDTALPETKPEAIAANKDSFLKRFRISTTAGAVYFEMGNSNTVDEQFADNAGGSDVSMAYGVNIAYQLSEKVKIRSGVSKVDFNYSTRQVDYSAASSSSAVRTDPAGMGVMLAAQGDLDQEFGFIEVPMEIEFTLIDKKIGLNLIGGASTLFLEENNLSMTTAAFTTDFGEAQNLNQLSFSANFGLGVHYKFTPKIRINLEPMFKYQLNTFDHGNSHYFGIYSGLSYQF